MSTTQLLTIIIPSTILVLVIGYLLIQVRKLTLRMQDFQKPAKKISGMGIIVNWNPSREDSSAYTLELYNDTAEQIFNIEAQIELPYRSCSKISWNQDRCESQKSMVIFLVPGGWSDPSLSGQKPTDRAHFLNIWLENKLKPIRLTILYTKTPNRSNFETIEVVFKKEQLTNHLKTRLRSLKAKSNLALVENDE
jgi:hypothetical protein